MIREEISVQSYMITTLYLTVLSAKTVFDLPDCTSKRMLTVMIIIDDDDRIEYVFVMMMTLLMMMMMMMMCRISVDEFVMFYGLTKVFKIHFNDLIVICTECI